MSRTFLCLLSFTLVLASCTGGRSFATADAGVGGGAVETTAGADASDGSNSTTNGNGGANGSGTGNGTGGANGNGGNSGVGGDSGNGGNANGAGGRNGSGNGGAAGTNAGPSDCGNGDVEAGEDCDDGEGNGDPDFGICSTDCTLPECGEDDTRSCEAGGFFGRCLGGVETCVDGAWSGECSIEPLDADTCEPNDDSNCNGAINEDCECSTGSVRFCSVGGLFGACGFGQQVCGDDGKYGDCSVEPGTDSCDTPADDTSCNGTPGEGCPCDEGDELPCGPETEDGACQRGTTRCQDGAWTRCEGAVYAGLRDCTSTEDNDCTGAPDRDECTCRPGMRRDCNEHEGKDGNGPCTAGGQECGASPDGSSSSWGDCLGAVGPAAQDSCSVLDDDADCDDVPNGGCECVVGQSSTCEDVYGFEGTCGVPEIHCTSAAKWSTDNVCEIQVTETCADDGRDENCDGTVNEDSICGGCDPNPCQHGGTCTPGGGDQHTCECVGGYGATDCQTLVFKAFDYMNADCSLTSISTDGSLFGGYCGGTLLVGTHSQLNPVMFTTSGVSANSAPSVFANGSGAVIYGYGNNQAYLVALGTNGVETAATPIPSGTGYPIAHSGDGAIWLTTNNLGAASTSNPMLYRRQGSTVLNSVNLADLGTFIQWQLGAMSADGKIVAGYAFRSGTVHDAFIWDPTNATPSLRLRFVTSATASTSANFKCVNNNGTQAGGWYGAPAGPRAARWTSAQGFSTLPGTACTEVVDLSDAGDRFLLRCDFGSGQEPGFFDTDWDEVRGVEDMLAELGVTVDGQDLGMTAISADGTTLLGTQLSDGKAWVADVRDLN